jgi:hypothetical protein
MSQIEKLITLDCRHKTTARSLLVNEKMPISGDTSLVILKDSLAEVRKSD